VNSNMKTRLPDFLIGGAARSGTTFLYHLLDRHPNIFMAKPVRPEPKFFSVDDVYSRGIGYYAETWFAEVSDASVAGEKSTSYLECPEAANRIARHLPKAKLIFILRDPVSRAFSNYLWSCMNQLETQSFEVALALEEQRERELPRYLRHARPHAYFSRGLYADLLRPYFARFPREQILCLRYEDVAGDAEGLTRRLHGFLGVVIRKDDARNLGVINPSVRNGRLSASIDRFLRQAYAEPNKELADLLGSDFQLWENSSF